MKLLPILVIVICVAIQDKPVRNSSLAKLFPVRTSGKLAIGKLTLFFALKTVLFSTSFYQVLSNVELNRMESEFLDEIKYWTHRTVGVTGCSMGKAY